MESRRHPLTSPSLGTRRELTSLHFGVPGAGGKVYIQASLHADELPGMLTAWHLRQRLTVLEAEGRLRGEVTLVPMANPVGLDQTLLGVQIGRFELGSGQNFNRYYPDLADVVHDAVAGRLGADAGTNVRLVREALAAALARIAPQNELDSLRLTLMQLAADADVVLDLHCDFNAGLHLYTLTPMWPDCEPLARYLGSCAQLLATESGDSPFDEACSGFWLKLQTRAAARTPATPIPLSCLAVTVELRGQDYVDHALAARDADAIIAFLTHRGLVTGTPPPLPALRHPATPLAGSETLLAPHPGVVAFHRAAGETVAAGDAVADIIDPLEGRVSTLTAPRAGMLYVRELRHYATTGMWVAKIATADAFRTGKLLSA